MEEYSKIQIEKQQQKKLELSINLEHSEGSKLAIPRSLHKHVSLIYGLQFQSKVSLFARQQSKSTTLSQFENLPKEELFKKVLCFLTLINKDSSIFQTFIRSFKQLDKEMQLSIKKSRNSIDFQNSSSITMSSGHENIQKKKGKTVLNQLTNSCPPLLIEEPALRKGNSMMSKSNKIQTAEAKNVTKMLAKIEAIQSAQSLESYDPSLEEEVENIRKLSSSDENTIPEISIKLEQKQPENKNKISIVLDDLSASSQLFSQGQTALSLSDIKLPKLKVDQLMLEVFFGTESSYLVNLSLCLFCKCLSRGAVSLTEESTGWLLGVSTIVAHKLYYDQTLQGLIEWFCQGMNMNLEQLVNLQRWFLGSLNYEVAVSTQQFQNMLMKLMTHF